MYLFNYAYLVFNLPKEEYRRLDQPSCIFSIGVWKPSPYLFSQGLLRYYCLHIKNCKEPEVQEKKIFMQLSSILTWALFLTPLIGWWCLIGTTVEQQSSGKEKIIGSRKGKKNLPSCLSCFRCNRSSTTVQFDQSSSQALCSDLGELQIKPDKLDLNSIRRESVIFRTPSQSPQDSLSNSSPSVISHS